MTRLSANLHVRQTTTPSTAYHSEGQRKDALGTMETPKKGVQWDINDISLSGLASPMVDGSMLSMISTSSLEYINSQLVAHGFAPSPGLSLDGIGNSDLDRVAKCLLGMLSQRVVGTVSPFNILSVNNYF